MKLLSTILVLAFILAALSTLAPTVAAKSGTISESEAKELVFKAYDAYNLLNTYGLRYEKYVYDYRDNVFLYEKVKDDSGDELYYYEVCGELLPGGSYEGFLKYADSVFTPEISAKFTSQAYANNSFPLFIEKDGIRYITESWVDFDPDYNEFVYDKGYNTVVITEGDNSSAKAVVLCDIISHIPITDRSWKRQVDYAEVECVFENTPSGWRIAESKFASMLMAPGKIEYEIYTGDEVGLRFFEYRLIEIMEFYNIIHSHMPYDENEYITPFGEDLFAEPWSEFTRYYLVKDDELPGVSYEGLVNESKKYFTDAAAKIFLNDYATEENLPLFYVQDGKRYAYFEAKNPWQFGDRISFLNRGENYGRPTIDSLVVDGDRATGKLICHRSSEDHPRESGYTLYAFEVVFVKTEQGWVLDDCEYLRAKTARTTLNADYSQYLVKDKSIYEKYGVGIPSNVDFASPDTGDNAFEKIALCLGGMAALLSAVGFVRRRRVEE